MCGIRFNTLISTNWGRSVKRDSKNEYSSSVVVQNNNNNFALYDSHIANINKSQISFKGYYGDIQPAKKLFYIVSGKNAVYEDAWTNQRLYQVGMKKWVNSHPVDLMKRTTEQVIQSICTLVKPNNQYPGIPSYIPTPNFGDKWGRRANYIEINPRILANFNGNRATDGLLQTLKILTAIPPSPNSFANCIVLSQLYPSLSGDGYKDAGSLYCTNLHSGISQTLTCDGLKYKMGDDEQVKAFNDLAHLMGFKTGFRMPLASGQMRVQGQDFDWNRHEKAFIDACVWGIELGFDSIYFDSAKHTVDGNGYCGIGNVPNRNQMAYILYEIRQRTGRNDISFVGEKCDNRQDFKDVGFTAGTDWGRPDDFESVRWESQNQSWSSEYAAGPEVSNDNDTGGPSFETRLNRLNSCLFGYNNVGEKIPSFMQLHDIFPLSPYVNTHDLMLNTRQMSGSGAWTECERHWDGIFNNSGEAQDYRQNVYHIFENVMRTKG